MAHTYGLDPSKMSDPDLWSHALSHIGTIEYLVNQHEGHRAMARIRQLHDVIEELHHRGTQTQLFGPAAHAPKSPYPS